MYGNDRVYGQIGVYGLQVAGHPGPSLVHTQTRRFSSTAPAAKPPRASSSSTRPALVRGLRAEFNR